MADYAGARAHARARARSSAEPLTFLRRLDWLLLGAVGALVAYGLWAIGGITRYDIDGSPDYYVVRQGIAAALGAVGMVVFTLVDPDLFRRYKRFVYGATTGLMLFVFALGEAARGSTRWITVGPFQFQPSEFGKLFFVLALAGFLSERTRRLGDVRVVATAIGVGLAPILLVFAQPDLGTAMVYGAALVACLFVAGVRWTHLAALAGATGLVIVLVLVVLPNLGLEVLKPYQTARLTGFMNPDQDPAGLTYNVTQSITAVGSGGLNGRGVDAATQTKLDYLPESGTDFVFAAFAEQRGFLGAALLLGLYLLVVWRGLRVVTVARDAFGAIVAGGIVLAFLFQVFVNIGMTMGIAPVTGIPLPYVTVGGSSMVANLLAVGVLQAIHARGREGATRRSR
jgi:rod shape determining protein RodA